MSPMAELALTRSGDDRRRYEIERVGTLRLGGFLSRGATAAGDGAEWSFYRRGFWQRTVEATDAAGDVVGSFQAGKLRRGGALRWGGRDLALRPASKWRERYALVDGDRELAALEGKGWGKRPVRIAVDDPDAVDPGLLLFATFVVRGLAEDAGAAVGASGAVG
jgi:hypothetical protein